MSGPDPLGELGGGSRAQGPPAPEPPPPPERRPRSSPTTVALLFLLGVGYLVQIGVSTESSTEPLTLYRLGALHWPSLLAGDWWRLGSYSFLHIGIAHLAMNCWALWALMRPTEELYGSTGALGLYAASVIAGGAASALSSSLGGVGNFARISAGASGGLFGLFGAQLALLVRLRGLVPPERLRAAGKAMLINLGLNLLLAVAAAMERFPLDNSAHLGGLFTGLLLGLGAPLVLQRPGPLRRLVGLVLLGCTLLLASMEGAAAARFARPAVHLLEGEGFTAELPFPLVQVTHGAAAAPGLQLLAEVAREPEALALQPGDESVRQGDRTWVRRRQGGSDGEKQLELLAQAGTGRLRITVSCAGPACSSQDAVAEALARTVRLR